MSCHPLFFEQIKNLSNMRNEAEEYEKYLMKFNLIKTDLCNISETLNAIIVCMKEEYDIANELAENCKDILPGNNRFDFEIIFAEDLSYETAEDKQWLEEKHFARMKTSLTRRIHPIFVINSKKLLCNTNITSKLFYLSKNVNQGSAKKLPILIPVEIEPLEEYVDKNYIFNQVMPCRLYKLLTSHKWMEYGHLCQSLAEYFKVNLSELQKEKLCTSLGGRKSVTLTLPMIIICAKDEEDIACDFMEQCQTLFSDNNIKFYFRTMFAEDLTSNSTVDSWEESAVFIDLKEMLKEDKTPVFVINTIKFLSQTEVNLKLSHLRSYFRDLKGSNTRSLIPVYPYHLGFHAGRDYVFKYITKINLYDTFPELKQLALLRLKKTISSFISYEHVQ